MKKVDLVHFFAPQAASYYEQCLQLASNIPPLSTGLSGNAAGCCFMSQML